MNGQEVASVDFQEQDSVLITRLLKESRQQPRTTCFPLFFARQFLGRPYVAHTLERPDADGREQLVVNTRQLDCTTLVESVTALTLCAQRSLYTWRDYLNALVSMRYRHGHINGYPSRLHYFTDWILQNTADSAGFAREIQTPESVFSALQTINVGYMSSHPESYAALRQHPEFVADILQQEQQLNGLQFRYIPKSAVRNTKALRQAIHDGDIIAITCSKAGLDIAHLGFAVWRSDGLHLLNASQLHKRVVEEPMTLGQYLSRHPSHTGIRIIRIP